MTDAERKLQAKRVRLAKQAKANCWPCTVAVFLLGIGSIYGYFTSEGRDRTVWALCVVGAIIGIILMQAIWYILKPYYSSDKH